MTQDNEALDANQVVAFNLAVARTMHGWTQSEAAERLEAELGEKWSVASWSAAERSVTGARVREFTAKELAALARTFNVPLAWFFVPPAGRGDRSDGSLSSEQVTVRYGAHEMDFLEALSALLPTDVSQLVDEIERRAVLQVDGDTDAERKRAAMTVLADHAIALIDRLRDSFRGADPDDMVEGYRRAAQAVDLILTLTGREPSRGVATETDQGDLNRIWAAVDQAVGEPGSEPTEATPLARDTDPEEEADR